MKKEEDEEMKDLIPLNEEEKFNEEEELLDLVNTMVSLFIPYMSEELLNPQDQDPELIHESKTPQVQARKLIYEANNLPSLRAKANIEKALALDPDCIEAYELSGKLSKTPKIAMAFYEKAIAIGRSIFGGKYLEENKGSFWGNHETRPFMRCLQFYSDCLIETGKVKEAVAILEEMIELNPNDNQGVRNQLTLYLIPLNEDEKFLKYSEKYEDDDFGYSLFNKALFAFKTEGETEHSNEKLLQALGQNQFVARKLLSKKWPLMQTNVFGIGYENEAIYYANFAHSVWGEIKGAKEWLKRHAF
jgi:tetratricopeptide (TPR) repeat protein